MTVTPTMRFAAFDMMLAASRERNYARGHLIDQARYWESFPESYTPAQVAAAQTFMVSIGTEGQEAALAAIADLVGVR